MGGSARTRSLRVLVEAVRRRASRPRPAPKGRGSEPDGIPAVTDRPLSGPGGAAAALALGD